MMRIDSALRAAAGGASILVPVGFFAATIVEGAVWPTGGEVFDYAFAALGFLCLITILAFVGYLYRSEAVPPDRRWLWVVVLLLANAIALPFFWYWYIRKPVASPALGH